MTLGLPKTKADLDNKMGQEVAAAWNALAAATSRLSWLNDSNLVPGPNSSTGFLQQTLGYTGGEETTLRAAFADLDKLRQIAHAAATQASANDFFFNAKLLGGITFFG
jgi:hypothetical protein